MEKEKTMSDLLEVAFGDELKAEQVRLDLLKRWVGRPPGKPCMSRNQFGIDGQKREGL